MPDDELGIDAASTGDTPDRSVRATLNEQSSPAERRVLIQGLYFLATGVWPVVHRSSFERLTGRKEDFWLAQTVGVLVACIGGVLLLAERRGRVSRELRILAGSSAAGLAAVDLVFALRGRISKIYLVDAAIQAPFVAGAIRRFTRG